MTASDVGVVDEARVREAHLARDKVLGEVRKVIIGQEDLVAKVLVALFAGGHVLLVGVPGLAKTLLVSTLAKALSMSFKRIQFTPDMMPSDITGTEVLQEDRATGEKRFTFVKGPVFTNLLLSDEINRTPPKTQAALLEAMQEKHVTVGRETYALEEPFMVMATQNPIEQEGTYPLPEAQQDRFMFNLWVDYPTATELEEIIRVTTSGGFEEPRPVLSGEHVLAMRQIVRQIPVSKHVLGYIVRLVEATHTNKGTAPEAARKYLDWGAGPRAGQYLSLGAKSRALLRGELQATIEDVRYVADGVGADDVIDALLEAVPETTPE